MKSGSQLNRKTAAAALKKAGRYGITSFVENKPAPRTFAIGISGVAGGDDAGALCKILSRIDGVSKASFNVKKKTATVIVADGTSLSKEAVAAALKKTRYKVTSFKMS